MIEAYVELWERFYLEHVKLLQLDTIRDSSIRNFAKKYFKINVDGIDVRIVRDMKAVKYNIVPSRTNTTAACFRVKFQGLSAIYAYAYMAGGEITYICTGYSFRSQDGEFRSGFIKFEQFEVLYGMDEYREAFDIVEKMVVQKLSTNYEFHVEMYFAQSESKEQCQKYENLINNLRLPIKLYILCWLRDFYKIHEGTMENHVNETYKYIIYQTVDIPIIERVINILDREGLFYLWYRINTISDFSEEKSYSGYDSNAAQCGQKLIPITVFEALKTKDINFNVWRELYITNLSTNLVINYISPSFPMITNWFYIQNSNVNLFDNPSMHEKYSNSKIASEVSVQLRKIDAYNYINNNRKCGPINNKFERLSRAIQKSIVYSDSDIRLTDLCICLNVEYAGLTWRNIPAYAYAIRHGKYIDIFVKKDKFFKLMFEYIYSLYCANLRMGVMHGDLHLNNVTLKILYTTDEYTNTKVLYILGEEAYLFPSDGTCAVIIDFSRGIIGDYDRIVKEFSVNFAQVFFKEQKTAIMNLLYHYFPDIVKKYKDKIESLIIAQPFLMFKIISALDTFVLMSNFIVLFNVETLFREKKLEYSPDIIPFLQTIVVESKNNLITNLLAVVKGDINDASDILWPNYSFLSLFSDYLFSEEKAKPCFIADIFRCDLDIVNDIDAYETFGNILSLEIDIDMAKKHNIVSGLCENQNDFLNAIRNTKDDDILKPYKDEESDTLQYESWMSM